MFNKERFEHRFFDTYDQILALPAAVIDGATLRVSRGNPSQKDILLLSLHSLISYYELKDSEWPIIEERFDILREMVFPTPKDNHEKSTIDQNPQTPRPEEPKAPDTAIHIYADGACSGNPGPGGYGCKLMCGEYVKEISGGFKYTTNNRMEIIAVIEGLRMLKKLGSRVMVHSDSKYVVDAFVQGWLAKWVNNEWTRKEGNKRVSVVNRDLWEVLLAEVAKHTVSFIYVKGHSSNPHNARCDVLAVNARMQANLPDDAGYLAANGANV